MGIRHKHSGRAAARLALAAALLASVAVLVGCSHSNVQGNGQTDGGPARGTPTTGSQAPTEGGKSLQIAVIPKGTTHEFWKSIHAGANKAQQELTQQGQAVQILWKGPAREDDRNAQIDVVETFLSQQVRGIVLAPLDAQALVRPVEDAVRQKVPVVIIDSGLNSKDYVSFVATDNQKGGLLAGQRLAQALSNRGRVLMLRYQQGSASTEQRETGFLQAMKQAPGITLVSTDQYSGPTVDTAYKSAQNLLSRYGTQVDGIFTPNESSTRGMRLALKDVGLLGKVKFVGFDASPDLIDALKANELQGLVVQNPFAMGYLGVKTLVQALQGRPVEKRIDTGVTLVTAENMNTPPMQELLHPPIERYLK